MGPHINWEKILLVRFFVLNSTRFRDEPDLRESKIMSSTEAAYAYKEEETQFTKTQLSAPLETGKEVDTLGRTLEETGGIP